MAQVFYASPTDTLTWPNGAVGHRGRSPFDVIGPYAKVRNCPIGNTGIRLTCYATATADTFFSIPACTRYKGKYVKGYFSHEESGIVFHVMDSHKHIVGL